MNPTLKTLGRSRGAARAAVERFLAAHDLPLVEPGQVTFLYRGRADAVHLRHWVYGLPDSMPFDRVGNTDLWSLEVSLPRGARIEYKLEVFSHGSSEWILDPLNPRHASDPYGANSVCWADGYQTPEWTLPDDGSRKGSVEEISVPGEACESVTTRVYVPARFRRTRRYPLLVMHDGGDFLRYADLNIVMDNLIHRLEIPELIVALHEPEERTGEYMGSEAHARYLSVDLLHGLEERFPLAPDPGSRTLLGASLGAVASLHAAWLYPGVWGRLALLSGSFAFADIGEHRRAPIFDPIAEFMNHFRRKPGIPADRLYIACGLFESLIYENRSLVPLLQAHGLELLFREVPDGHHWQNWRDRLREALCWLLPGPGWMVYQ